MGYRLYYRLLNWTNSKGWKAELTLDPPIGFETGISELVFYHPNHYAIASWMEYIQKPN